MLSTNTNFDAIHDLDRITPLYLVHFDSGTTDYCNHEPESPTYAVKKYLKKIEGISQTITPEEGQSSIDSIKIEILDIDNEITSLLSTDSYYFHNKKVTIKAGYLGLAEADLLTIKTGWVTNCHLSSNGTAYTFEITDPQRWMQRKLFRESSSTTVYIQGNPINIVLGLLTSDGSGSNGSYSDYYDDSVGLNIDYSTIDIEELENLRDEAYPADSNYMYFTINEPETARDWLSENIFKPLNLYPIVKGNGKFSLKPFKPSLPIATIDRDFNEDNIINEIPKWSANFTSMINEVLVKYNYDVNEDEFLNEDWNLNTDSINNRGPGKKTLTLACKGWQTDLSPSSIPDRVTDNITKRVNKIFQRWSDPPPAKISFSTLFYNWLFEAGDIAPFSHSQIPDLTNGTRGVSLSNMEVIDRSINWKDGKVSFTLLDTGFAQSKFAAISPSMDITAVTSINTFAVSSTDAAKFVNFTNSVVNICDSGMRSKLSNIAITGITSGGSVTTDNVGTSPAIGYKVVFDTYDNLSVTQQLYCNIGRDVSVVTGISTTQFQVSSTTEAGKFTTGDYISIYDEGMRIQNEKILISSISGITITTEAMSSTPEANWICSSREYGLITP